MEKKVDTVNVLWTGGFDSSYRVIQLSKKNVVIQPYYLSDNRKSEKNELNAIAEITEDIKKNPETKSTILPLIIHNVLDIRADEEITKAYYNLRKISPLGSQYDWLARFAKEKQIQGLELGIEKAESSIVGMLFIKLGETKLIAKNGISYHIINKEKSNTDLYKVFGQFHYPIPLFVMTKLETLAEYKKLGFEESINKTWFCHRPINNEPCGLCNPCKCAIAEGMEFRFPKSSLTRYKYQLAYKIKNLIQKALKKANPF